MYWPTGAPRIYAASSSRVNKHQVVEFDDDAESRETTEGSGSLLNAPSVDSESKSDDGPSAPSTPPVTPGIQPVEQFDTQRYFSTRLTGQNAPIAGGVSDSTEKEPLIALRISRTGHLFAVITETSLTIWQTKVRHLTVALS